MNESIRERLRDLVRGDSLLPDGERERWSVGSFEPSAVVAPGDHEELAKVLAWCAQEGLRVAPAGLGTWLEAGEGRDEVDLVVTTRRLQDIQQYEPADLTITAGAGIPMADLSRATGANGQWLPLDPPGARNGSLGALVSLGHGGPLRHRYGAPRDMVLGLTMVSGRGEVLRWGGRVVKNVAGFDLTRLLTGSRGSLGVITSVSTRLFPLPERDLTLLWTAPEWEDLADPGIELAQAALPLAGVQLFDPCPGTEWTEPGRAVVAARLLGSVAEVEDMATRAQVLFGQEAGSRLEGGESRRFHETANAGNQGASGSLRMTVFPALVRGLVEEAAGVRALPGMQAGGSGAAGAALVADLAGGVLRMALPEPAPTPDQLETWGEALTSLGGRLEAKGGSLAASGKVRALVPRAGGKAAGDGEARLVEGLRLVFDPSGVFSSGPASS